MASLGLSRKAAAWKADMQLTGCGVWTRRKLAMYPATVSLSQKRRRFPQVGVAPDQPFKIVQ